MSQMDGTVFVESPDQSPPHTTHSSLGEVFFLLASQRLHVAITENTDPGP